MSRYLQILACALGLTAVGTACGQEPASRQERAAVQCRHTQTQQTLTVVPCIPFPCCPVGDVSYVLQLAEALGPCVTSPQCPQGSCGVVVSRSTAVQCPAAQCCCPDLVGRVLAETAANLLPVCRILYNQGRYTEMEYLARKIVSLDPCNGAAQGVLKVACQRSGYSNCSADCSRTCSTGTCASKSCGGKKCACTSAKKACACGDNCCCAKDGGKCECGADCKCKPATKTSEAVHSHHGRLAVIVIAPGHVPPFPLPPVGLPMPCGPTAFGGMGLPPVPPFPGMVWPGCPATVGGIPMPPAPPVPPHMVGILPMPRTIPAVPTAASRVVPPPTCAAAPCVPNTAACSQSSPAAPIKITASGNRIHIDGPGVHVECESLTVGEGNRVTVKGPASVEFRGVNPQGVQSSRQLSLNLIEGTLEVNPQAARTSAVRTTNPCGGIANWEKINCLPNMPQGSGMSSGGFIGATNQSSR